MEGFLWEALFLKVDEVHPERQACRSSQRLHGQYLWFGANHHLRQSLVFVNVPTMAQPEAYIGGATELCDDSGNYVQDGKKPGL